MVKFERQPQPERGQALLLIALAFVGLVVFTGLAVDAGVLYSYIGHLRKGVDTAALSATNQYRRGKSAQEIQDSAKEFILLNLPGSDPVADVLVQTCNDVPQPAFCIDASGEQRKRVAVRAQTRVPLYFLRVIGFSGITIQADAQSEAASVDLILILDNSPSMAYDTPAHSVDEVTACNGSNTCEPFRTVKESAKELAKRMYYPYDRMAIVNFSRYAPIILDLSTCNLLPPSQQESCVTNAIDNMQVELPLTSCPYSGPNGCTTTNISASLMQAHRMFRDQGRADAVWVVVFLSDGVANAAHTLMESVFAGTYPPADPTDVGWWCPKDPNSPPAYDTWADPPFCQDGLASQTHATTDPAFDADDAARYMASFLACVRETGVAGCPPAGGDGAILLSIGLGTSVYDYNPDPATYPTKPYPWDEDVGERLLRFLANVGADGRPDGGSLDTDPCYAQPSKKQCGNYYFAQDASDLTGVFRSIADRIFTRLIH